MKDSQQLRPRRQSLWPASAWGAVITACLMLVWQAPASCVARVIDQFSQGRIRLQNPTGTAWQGSAHLALSAGHGTDAAPTIAHRLAWHIGFDSPTRIRLSLRWLDDPNNAGVWSSTMTWQPQSWWVEFGDLDWTLPGSWLAGLGAPWNTVRPEGQIRVQSQSWRIEWAAGHTRSSGELELTLHDFATGLSSLRPLGDYRLSVHHGEPTRMELSTLKGPLHLQGQGQWLAGRLQFEGQAWAPAPDDETALAHLLSVLGQRNGARAWLKMG